MIMDKILVASVFLFIPLLGILLLSSVDFHIKRSKVRKIQKILGLIRPHYFFEMYGAEVNPFTGRGIEKYTILEIKDKWVKYYDNNGLESSDKIEDLIGTMKRKEHLNRCEGWYLKDENGNILLSV